MPLNFSERFPSNSALGRALRFPLRLIPRNTVVRIVAGPARGMRWVVSAGTHGMWLGTYETRVVQEFVRLANALPAGRGVVDVGAHVGYFTVAALKVRRGRGRVLAIEPVPRNFERLRRHVNLNGCGPSIILYDAAAADRSGEMRFADTHSDAMGHLAPDGTRTVATIALDDVAGLIAPGLLKIDVEGAGAMVLRGAYHILTIHRPAIILSVHVLTNEPAECRALLDQYGYTIRVLPDDPNTWVCLPR